ncbi:MAG: SRPBCC family protein [Verrucomicrobiales bacterium]
MKCFLRIVAVVSLLVLLLLGGLFFFVKSKIDDTSTLSRDIVIAAPPAQVYPYLATMENWPQWSPWAKMDPEMTVEYFGPPSGVGAGYTWQSDADEVGTGSITTTAAEPGKSLAFDLKFGDQGGGKSTFQLAPEGDGNTKLTWGFESETKSFGEKIFWMAFEGAMATTFVQGLQDIKEIAESGKTAPAGETADPPAEPAPEPAQ